MSRSMLARLLRLGEARTPDVGPVRAIVIRTATEADGRLRLSQLRASGEAPLRAPVIVLTGYPAGGEVS
jgi:hypothetical protein